MIPMRSALRCGLVLACVSLGGPGYASAQSLAARIEASHRTYLPSGDGPFPTVVAIPGCSGVSLDGPLSDAGRPGREGDRLFRRHYPRMAERLRARGFAVILVDYLGAEGVANTCAREISHERVGEYVGASLDFARKLPTTDSRSLFVVGWSHGGAGVIAWLQAVGTDHSPAVGAVAVYPECDSRGPWRSSMPILVLLGGADDIALPERCDRIARQLSEETDARFTRYPEGRHGFDMTEGPEVLDIGGGMTLGRNDEAGEAAWSEIFRFLDEVGGAF